MKTRFSYQNIFSGWLLLVVFSLSFTVPFAGFFGQRIPLTDFLFIPLFLMWMVGIITKKISFKFHKFYWFLLFYLTAIFISVVFSANFAASFLKFFGEIYLVFLCVIIYSYIENFEDLKKLILAWLAGTFFVVIVGLTTLFLFYFFPQNPLLDVFQNHYGTVPIGNYPRIKGTFFHSNMLCNYLSASLMLVIAAGRLRWINSAFSKIFIGLILIISLFTFSPGLGGIALSLGIYFWLYFKSQNQHVSAFSFLSAGVFVAVFFLLMLVIAMQTHPTAPFVIQIPFTQTQIYPSSRIMVWTATFETFYNNFWNGIGLGEDVCRVRYLNPSGVLEDLRDGHNTFLNVAAQTGITGLLSISAITFYLLKKIFAFPNLNNKAGFFYNCCGLAILSAFIYQGLGGSFEETRHIWVLFGLFFSSEKLLPGSNFN